VAYLVFAVLASAFGITVVVWRNRPKTSTDESIREFGRNLDALAPQDGAVRGARPRSKG
jgi:hypothetical protein